MESLLMGTSAGNDSGLVPVNARSLSSEPRGVGPRLGILDSGKGRNPWLYTWEGIESQDGCKAGKWSPSQTITAGPQRGGRRGTPGGTTVETVLKQTPF